jgi:gluconolactonase
MDMNGFRAAAWAIPVFVVGAIPIPSAGAERITESAPKLEGDVMAGEGPSWDPAGYLYFVGRARISRRDAQGKVEVFKEPAGGPNGSLIDPERRLLICEAGGRRVVRYEKDGTVTVLADNYQGSKFNSPNDLSIDSKGRIYFTDPRYGRRDTMEMKDASGRLVEGVYRIDAPGQAVRIISNEVERPNGILVSPDDRYLYIADNNNNNAGGARKLYRFDLKADGTIAPGSRKLIFDWHTARGPDGFKMDREGRFYVAAGLNKANQYETTDEFQGGIFILSPKGELLEFVPIPGPDTTNCAFGDSDLKTLYITSGGRLWSVRVKTPGLITAR